MRALYRVVFLGVSFCAGLIAAPGFALTFDVSFDASVASAPAGFTSAFTYATNSLSSLYSDPITINMNVGWGEIAGGPLQPGDIGQSLTNQSGATYAQVKTALIADATSATDFQAISTLGADPTGGRPFLMSTAEAKALGLYPGNALGIDGYVGFNKSVGYTFDPNNRAVPGEVDFIGLAFHEITEVMGRYGMTQNGCGAPSLCDSPIDLFRYTAPRVFALNPANGTYFSINSGVTNINTFNGTGGGDLSDWAGLTTDSLNALSHTEFGTGRRILPNYGSPAPARCWRSRYVFELVQSREKPQNASQMKIQDFGNWLARKQSKLRWTRCY